MTTLCSICNKGTLHSKVGKNPVEFNGQITELDLYYSVCDYCECEQADSTQTRENKSKMETFKRLAMYDYSRPILETLKSFFVLNHLHGLPDGIKQKRELAIEKAYLFNRDNGKSLFEQQFDVLTVIRQIEETQLLALNDVAIRCFVDEYKTLFELVMAYKERYLKLMKGFQEMVQDMNMFKKDTFKSMLYHDLKVLSEQYTVDVDFKVCKEL